MKNFFKRLISLSLAALFVLSLATGIFAAKDESDLTVLFTHDLHSHFLPSASETGGVPKLSSGRVPVAILWQ